MGDDTGAGKDMIPLLTTYKMGRFQLSHRVVLAPPPPDEATVLRIRAAAARRRVLRPAHDQGRLPHRRGHRRFTRRAGTVLGSGQVSRWKRGSRSWTPCTPRGECSSARYGTPAERPITPNGQAPVSSTNRPVSPKESADCLSTITYAMPRRLTADEIPAIVDDFRIAARNAVEAGFDGVEVHGAHGYLIDQFLKDGVNDRTDEYGGSLANRCRFALDVVAAVSGEVGPDRVGVRLSPYTDYIDAVDSDPDALGLHMARALGELGVLYLHAVEPRMLRPTERGETRHSLRSMRDAFGGTFIVAGGYTKEDSNQVVADGYADLVAYGRLFLANPDLPRRFELDAPLNKYNRKTFYTPDPVVGYTDYPFLDYLSK